MRKLIALTLLPLALSNCALLVVGAAGEAGVSTVEERSYSTKVEDHTLYVKINDEFIKSGQDGLTIDATVNVRHSRVMLTGNIASQALVDKAVAATWRVKGVKEVINEMVVNPDAGFTDEANDIAIKKNLVARMIFTKDVWYINYSIDVVNGNAYLLGATADRAEMNRALNVVRTTKGVKKVVNHLQIEADAHDSASNPDSMVTAAPVAPVVNVPATNTSSLPPTDGTISTDSVSSGDLTAPPAAFAAPASPQPGAPAAANPNSKWR